MRLKKFLAPRLAVVLLALGLGAGFARAPGPAGTTPAGPGPENPWPRAVW